jgi:hypothetical protein
LIDLFIKYPSTYYELEEELNKYELIENKSFFQKYRYQKLRYKYVDIYWNNIRKETCRCEWQVEKN